MGIAFRECNSEPKFTTPSPPEVFPWCYDPFIADPRIVPAVIDDQVLCALTLQIATMAWLYSCCS
jgi:hypothetical protein